MRIEQRHIVINSDNIEYYRSQGGLRGGSHDSAWNFYANSQGGNETVIVYSYSFDRGLKIPSYDPIYLCAQRINSQQKRIVAHEMHHAHNSELGLRFHLSGGFCFRYVAHVCLDEISARTAEALYAQTSTPLHSIHTGVLKMFGHKPTDRAFKEGLEQFSGVFHKYCEIAVADYAKCISRYLISHQDMWAFLNSQNQLYSLKMSDLRLVLYEPDFVRAVQHYFTFSNGQNLGRFSTGAKNQFRAFWDKAEPVILDISRKCVSDLMQKIK
ncbi:MAG: hypothetical protein IKJ68_07770 [Clostridia bacterium]|nr:hypothetical protein [Clostridia bacterium]